ncbi:MAG: formylglycine-generating enzyme family protein [Gemmataceae bacterium]|nr:formylglycine-generating enzyme family protein [Gemmataceae bacterium]
MMGNSHAASKEVALLAKYGHKSPETAFRYEYPAHRVKIPRPFWMGAHHATRGQFRQFVQSTGYVTDAEKPENPGAMASNVEKGAFFQHHRDRSWRNVGFEQTDDHPVVCVSWNDAQAFCNWLSKKEGTTYRLPTEAEWEYACRAGTTSRYWCGDDPEKLAKVDNIADADLKKRFPLTPLRTISAGDGYVFTSPVGSFRANPFGLHDMHGNVFQWCQDRWSSYDEAVQPNYTPGYMLRGGSWNGTFRECRCANRMFHHPPETRSDYYGFRVVRELGKSADKKN